MLRRTTAQQQQTLDVNMTESLREAQRHFLIRPMPGNILVNVSRDPLGEVRDTNDADEEDVDLFSSDDDYDQVADYGLENLYELPRV